MKIDNIDLISDMYTKISDIKFKDDIENNIKIKNNIENNIKFKSDNENAIENKKYNSNLDFLLYEEDKPPKKIIKNIKPKKKIKENNYYKIYISIFILFCFLNSYWIINILNSNKISYKTSIIIRGLLFILCYYFISKF